MLNGEINDNNNDLLNNTVSNESVINAIDIIYRERVTSLDSLQNLNVLIDQIKQNINQTQDSLIDMIKTKSSIINTLNSNF